MTRDLFRRRIPSRTHSCGERNERLTRTVRVLSLSAGKSNKRNSRLGQYEYSQLETAPSETFRSRLNLQCRTVMRRG